MTYFVYILPWSTILKWLRTFMAIILVDCSSTSNLSESQCSISLLTCLHFLDFSSNKDEELSVAYVLNENSNNVSSCIITCAEHCLSHKVLCKWKKWTYSPLRTLLEKGQIKCHRCCKAPTNSYASEHTSLPGPKSQNSWSVSTSSEAIVLLLCLYDLL